ncbi:hypothetical protein HAHI6034_11130 [Hathewaya histolytica]|uniref:Uncharacterized protein n=1 Tax=Hathewaya histolytica TaxID=1498 RepID=A0A4U9RA35_HATHI|nr:hypothetical protein [Hathewaya histolytica]VTQ88424.1 Uncharacterised protein [Hathewaya histolytica]
MINKNFNTKIVTEVTEITFNEDAVGSATLETEEGLSTLNKFMLIDLGNPNESEIIFYNLVESEKEKACEILEKTLFEELSYSELESRCYSLESDNEELKSEIDELKEINQQLRYKNIV